MESKVREAFDRLREVLADWTRDTRTWKIGLRQASEDLNTLYDTIGELRREQTITWIRCRTCLTVEITTGWGKIYQIGTGCDECSCDHDWRDDDELKAYVCRKCGETSPWIAG